MTVAQLGAIIAQKPLSERPAYIAAALKMTDPTTAYAVLEQARWLLETEK